MIIYNENKDQIKPINHYELQWMAYHLEKYIRSYVKHFHLLPDERVYITKICDIIDKIRNQEYDDLLIDTSIIDYDPKNEISDYDDYPF